MNAAIAEESSMLVEDQITRVADRITRVEDRIIRVEDRIARVESDVVEVKSNLKMLNTRINDFQTEVAKEFGAVRAELWKSVESLRTSIERTKVWMLGTGITTVLGVAAVVGFKLH